MEQEAQKVAVLDSQTDILARKRYAYVVTRPERATLVLRKLRNNRWQIAILKARGGARVKRETMRAVEEWLARGNTRLPWSGTDYAIRM